MATPAGQGMQYWQAVQGTFIRRRKVSAAWLAASSSVPLMELISAVEAVLMFSSTCLVLFMPERTLITPGWFQTLHGRPDSFRLKC